MRQKGNFNPTFIWNIELNEQLIFLNDTLLSRQYSTINNIVCVINIVNVVLRATVGLQKQKPCNLRKVCAARDVGSHSGWRTRVEVLGSGLSIVLLA